ncbi:hypothetical protein PENSUB_2107 [Penicillium subrubescens]|uniref:Uncharacterized protein n=1 Tax=Penicillium subrubescens TaxID=1316194 RepID=A0A1Q5UIT3_9EURO|nr:hypothetical protein PENSUB_2107 [Penicillium subrubescens]
MTYIRVHNAGDDSTKSPTSTLLQPQAGIKLTNQLSYLLNKERNELMKYELAIPTTTTSSHIVATMLSTKPVITSKSSLPVLRQNQQSIRVVGYRCIGFGQCGIICERLGIAYVVKLARPMYKKGLWAGFKPTSLSEKHSNKTVSLGCISDLDVNSQNSYRLILPFAILTYILIKCSILDFQCCYLPALWGKP